MVGNTNVQIQFEKFAPYNAGIYYINLHSDETTSVEAVQEYISTEGGIFLHIIHTEERNIAFNLNNTEYLFDPNRIYTAKGIKATLTKNATYTKQADEAIKKFADTVLAQLKNPKLIVAMHNNGDKKFSIKSYTKNKEEAINAAKVYINAAMDEDDFVYTTEEKIFNHLKQNKINVVLQKKTGFVNDGSLSVYCGLKKIPYINVEAEQGHKEQQLQMLQILTQAISWYK